MEMEQRESMGLPDVVQDRWNELINRLIAYAQTNAQRVIGTIATQ